MIARLKSKEVTENRRRITNELFQDQKRKARDIGFQVYKRERERGP